MKLIELKDQKKPAFGFTCLSCNGRFQTDLCRFVFADLDGEPFKAYYCEHCAGIYGKMIAADIEIACHETDLYVPVNYITTAIISGYEHKGIVTRFISQVDNTAWYDIPFAYMPEWIRKTGRA
jgi:hypothetical protein